jgi:hypothetical protein
MEKVALELRFAGTAVPGPLTERQASVARIGHTASLLPRGQVLLLGGASGSGAWPLKAAELYD